MHVNDSGPCAKCDEQIARYPGFSNQLNTWFQALRITHSDAHISCAGRGKKEQNECFARGVSRAKWTQSSHNYNAALDLFRLNGSKAEWPEDWFHAMLDNNPEVGTTLTWYGAPNSPFRELPHIQIADWKERAESGEFKLVE